MGLGRGVGEQRAKIAAQAAANSPLLETSIEGARKLLVNVTAGADFSIGEAHEAMEYILQFTHSEDADIILGHVMRENPDNEVQITLLAAGMDVNAKTAGRVNREVFVQPDIVDSPRPEASAAPEPIAMAQGTLRLEEIDLDIPTFLRRQRTEG
jgi:cell division protein FtsZ